MTAAAETKPAIRWRRERSHEAFGKFIEYRAVRGKNDRPNGRRVVVKKSAVFPNQWVVLVDGTQRRRVDSFEEAKAHGEHLVDAAVLS